MHCRNAQPPSSARIREVFNLGPCPIPTGEERHATPLQCSAKYLRRAALVLIAVALLDIAAGAASGPIPPCDGRPQPSYAAPGESEHFGIWTGSDLGGGWSPPHCTGWTGFDFRIIVALAARFRDPVTTDQLLARFGAISSLVGVRYWSATERTWRELITSATAVEGSAGKQPRADFSISEMRSGKDLYFGQTDNRSAGIVVYRMRILEAAPDRVAVSVENVTSIRLLLVTLFPPNGVQSVHILERQPDGGWGYYTLMRTRANSSFLTGSFASSYVNRAVAFYRHIAGIPEDAEPAAAR